MTAFRARGQPSWPESDSPFGDNGRGFGQHQACTADRAATEMHEVPVVCKSRSHWNTGTSAKRRFDSARSHHEVRGLRRARRPPVPRTRRPRARRPGGPRRSGAAFDVLSRRADASCRFTQQGGRVPRCTGSRHAASPTIDSTGPMTPPAVTPPASQGISPLAIRTGAAYQQSIESHPQTGAQIQRSGEKPWADRVE